MLIHCSPKTLAFFDNVLTRIRTEKLLDQVAFEQEALLFDGTLALFDSSHFLQSNMLTEDSTTMKIIQCLTSESNSTDIYLEKVSTIMSFFDISHIQQYLPEDVKESLHTELRVSEP